MERKPEDYLDLAKRVLQGDESAKREAEDAKDERAGVEKNFRDSSPNKTVPAWMLKEAEAKEKGLPPDSV